MRLFFLLFTLITVNVWSSEHCLFATRENKNKADHQRFLTQSDAAVAKMAMDIEQKSRNFESRLQLDKKQGRLMRIAQKGTSFEFQSLLNEGVSYIPRDLFWSIVRSCERVSEKKLSTKLTMLNILLAKHQYEDLITKEDMICLQIAEIFSDPNECQLWLLMQEEQVVKVQSIELPAL